MSLETRVADLEAAVELINNNAKNIAELPDLTNPVAGNDEIALRVTATGQTVGATIVQLQADMANFIRAITISTKHFLLFKHQDNNDALLRGTLEEDDIIFGYNTFGDLMFAVFLGGDETDFRNVAVWDVFGGFRNESV